MVPHPKELETIAVILLVDNVTAGLAVGGILVMKTEAAPGTDDLLFCCNVNPFPNNAAYLPGNEDDP
jgi:hypothetical protein